MLATASAAPGFWDWSLDPPLVLVVDLAVLYWLGARRTITPARKRTTQHWRDAAFYTAMVVLAIALASPLERLSEQLFWAHMVQHVLLMLVAAPLVVIARPWVRLWRALPLSGRRRLARWFVFGERAAPLRTLSASLGAPVAGLIAFTIVLLGWHLPVMFDATLESGALHALEHTLFFAASLLLFKQVIPSPPLRSVLSETHRLLYMVAAMTASWVLAVVLAIAPRPLYAHYAHLSARPGGISALADQQIAAGIMWVPGSVTFMLVIFVYVHRWLAPSPSEKTATAAPGAGRLAGEH